MSGRAGGLEEGALAQLDGGYRLLRLAPVRYLAAYAAATLPFLALVALWWDDLSWGELPPGRVGAWSVVLLVAFVVMRTGQTWFMAGLRATLAGEPLERWSVRDWGRVLLVNGAVQPASLALMPVAVVLLVPAPWVQAFFQTAVLEAARLRVPVREVCARSLRLSTPWSVSLGTVQALVVVVGAVVWMNLMYGAGFAVFVADAFLGVSIGGDAGVRLLMSSTALVVGLLVTYALIDPLQRAWMVYRVHRLAARSSGADLLREFREAAERRASRATAAAAVLLAVVCVAAAVPAARAESSGRAPGAGAAVERPLLRPEDVDRRVSDVLTGREYRWRRAVAGDTSKEPSWISELRAWFRKVREWIEGLFKRRDRERTPARTGDLGGSFSVAALRIAAAILIVAILVVVVRAILRRRREAPEAEAAALVVARAADLEREDVTAADRPSDAWERLARELTAAGDWRLALRAWHLAALARMGERGVLTLRKSKSDRDYERELERRGLEVLRERFREQRTAFECRWYGRTAADAAVVEVFARPWELP